LKNFYRFTLLIYLSINTLHFENDIKRTNSHDGKYVSGTMAVPRAQVLPIGVTGLQPTNFPYRTYVPAPPNGRNQLQEIFTGLQQKQELSEKVQRQIVPEITRSNPLADKKTKKIPLKKRID